MKLDNLEKLIGDGESEILEFKKSTAQLQAAFETICAFLNGKGGTVLIGVTNDGKVVGQNVTDSTRKEIANFVTKLEPSAQSQIKIEYLSLGNVKHVISIKVKPGKHAPYVYDGRAFYRNQSTTSKIPQHRYEQLLIARGQLNYSWEELVTLKFSIDDLNHEEIRKTVEQGIRFNRIPAEAAGETIENLLHRLKLLQDGQLNNAAVILFGKDLFPAYSQCLIKMARFRGLTKLGDFMDSRQIYGNAFEILAEADNFLTRHLPIASIFHENKFERTDEPAIPVLALREALVNAICHRDYSDPSAAISLAIFDDRVELWNYGALPQQIKIKDLKQRHESCLRNKIIANVVYSRGFIEKWGTGINKMITYCKTANIPEPGFEEYSGGFAVIFKLKEPMGASINKPMASASLRARQEEVLEIIKRHGSVSLKQIIAELSSPPSERVLRLDLKLLKNKELIELTGRTWRAKWTIKNQI